MSVREGFIGLGSNLGDPRVAMEKALRLLSELSVGVIEVSSLYRSEPVDAPPQPWFLNAVARVASSLEPRELLSRCQMVEALQGRVRTIPQGPRTIDLDLLLYGDALLETEELRLPHPRLHLRRFVLVPLAEIAPQWVHPRLGMNVAQLLAACPDASTVVRLGPLPDRRE